MRRRLVKSDKSRSSVRVGVIALCKHLVSCSVPGIVHLTAPDAISNEALFGLLSFRAEGSNLLLDPHSVCKKTRRLRGKLHDICRNDTGLMKEIAKGIEMGFRECEYQFKNRRWNCTLIKPNMKKILGRGKF